MRLARLLVSVGEFDVLQDELLDRQRIEKSVTNAVDAVVEIGVRANVVPEERAALGRALHAVLPQ